ncbi:EAL domain-containing protein [Pseudomonadota bacterium]
MKTINLKAHILLPFVFVSVLTLAIFVISIHNEEQTHINDGLAHSIQAVEGYYHEALNERAHKLGAALEVIANNSSLRTALKAGDRDALLTQSMPIFQNLKTKHNITHFYFHDTQRVNILRVHQPHRHGDVINRFTAQGAENSRTLFHGVELGPMGTFTLRAVIPLWEKNRLLGYVELGEEIDQVIQDMAVIFNVDLVVAINKQYLRRSDWESGMEMLGRNVHWDHFPNLVIVSQTLGTLPNTLRAILSNLNKNKAPQLNNIEITKGEQNYHGRVLTLHDAGGRTVGNLSVLRDMTAGINRTNNTVIIISFSAFVLGALLFLLLYVLIGRTETQLKALLTKLRYSQSRLNNAQRMAHLGNWEWDTKSNVLNCSDEAAYLLGLEPSDCPCTYDDLFSLVHPADQNSFREFIDNARNNNGVAEFVHRINHPNGSERIIHHRIESARTPSGEIHTINAAIHDITNLRQAEMRSARQGRILEHSWNEIFTFDADTLTIIEASDCASQNLGYTMDELTQITPLDLNPNLTLDQFEALLGPLRRGEKPQVTVNTELQRKNGSFYSVEVRIQFCTVETPPIFIAIIQDISERQHYIAELEHKALYDSLTDLPNRFTLQDRLEYALNMASRNNAPLAVLTLDIIRLREINDILGHSAGDEVIQEIASRLQNTLRESDTVSRLGGDEYAMLLPNTNAEQAIVTAKKIQKLFEQPVIINNTSLEIEAAIGVALYPEHSDKPAPLLQYADIAMRIAKNEAYGFSIYTPEENPYSLRRLKLLGELRRAIEHKTLTLYYQPQIDLKLNRIISVEALARWPHPEEGQIPPAEFIPMVEQSGLIRPFTLWVLEETITQLKRWHGAHIELSIAVNLSARNLLDVELPNNIRQLLEKHNVSPEHLIIEVTESAIMSRPELALKVLMQLHDMGLKLSIDDFGTGYSSLAYLKKLPVHELKIDQSFVFGLTTNEDDAVIVRSTIDLAQNMGLKVVAEGVENQDVMNELATLDCDVAQGFHMSHPVSVEALEQWLACSPWGLEDDGIRRQRTNI